MNVTVSVIIDNREAFETASGTVYGPPPVRNSCGAVNVICATDAGAGVAGVGDGGAVTSLGGAPVGAVGGAPGAAVGGVVGVVVPGGTVGGVVGVAVAGGSAPTGGGRNCGVGVVIGTGAVGAG